MTDATLPSGVTYEEVSDIIERIATQKAYKHRNIGFFGPDDIRQEVRIKCWMILPRYDPTRCGHDLKIFLGVCAENRLRDIRRSVMYKHNKPCFKCPFWIEEASLSGCHDCLVFGNKLDCIKWSKHERYVQAKLSASHPIDIDTERIPDGKFERRMEEIDMVDYILAALPSGLHELFKKLESVNFNLKSLKARERAIISSALRVVFKDTGRIS